MTDETGSPAGGEAIFSTELPADAPEEFGSAREAAAYFTDLKSKKPPAESAEPATTETELSVEDNAAPQDEVTGETQETDPPEQAPLELPRSWTKEQAEHWNALPRATQEYLTERASKDSEAVRKVQNDAAEKLKGLTAKEQQVEQVRLQFEAKIKTASEILEREQLRDFPDIKSMADVERMALEDPFRKIQWDVHQQRMQAVAWEANQADQRKAQQQQTDWQSFRQKESALAVELVPDLADEKKGPELMAKAAKLLRDVKFSQDELNALDAGEKISPFDHRMQSIIADAVRYRDIIAAKTAVAAKPLPPVQRPGSSKPAGSVVSDRLRILNLKPELTVKEATELYTLQQSSQRRAS